MRLVIKLIGVLLLSANSWAMDVQVKMLAKGSALLEVNGKQHMMRAGKRSPEGVLLVSADGKGAVIEVDGERYSLGLKRSIATGFVAPAKAQVRIASSNGGHYRTPGRINGLPVQFMVDTGATSVAMNRFEAERLGIDYRAGRPISVNTANGVAQAFVVTLQKVSVGDLELHQVEANVSTSESPSIILLGNSYLRNVDLAVDNGVLVLTSKH